MLSKKVILTGSFGVGKTSLFNRFIYDQFDDKYITTIGVKVNKKVIKIGQQEIALLLWDIAGEVTQDKVPASYFLGTSGILYVIDLSRPSTFESLAKDIEYLHKIQPKAIIKVIGNKADLLTNPQIEAVKATLAYPLDILTSAKTGENVLPVFEQIATAML